MVKKKNKKINIGIIILILAGIILFGKFNTLSITTETLRSGTQSSPFICDSGEGINCDVKGVISCSSQTASTPKVIARADNSDYSEGWIAIYNKVSNSLTSYCDGGDITYSSISRTEPVNLPYSITGYLSFGPYNPCKTSKCLYIVASGDHYHEFEPSGVCNSDLSPTPKYNCQNQELCEGYVNKYSCSGKLTIKKSDTDSTILYSESLNYSSSIAGEIKSKQYIIQPGNKAELIGGDLNKIEFIVKKTTQLCSFDSQCNADNTGVIKCVSGVQQPVEFCSSGVCIDNGNSALCDDPVKISSANFYDSNNNIIQSYGTDVPITFRATFISKSQTIQSAIVNVKLVDASQGQVIESKASRTISIPLNTLKVEEWKFNGIETPDKYKVVVDVQYGNNQKIIPTPSYDFNIALPVDITLKYTSKQEFTDAVFSNKPFFVQVYSKQSGEKVLLDKLDLVVAQEKSILSPKTSQIVPIAKGDSYLYEFEYNPIVVTSPEEVKIEATGTLKGSTDKENLFFQMYPPSIQINIVNQESIPSKIKPLTFKFMFETKTPQGELIDTNNVVISNIGGKITDISNIVIRESVGKYSFDFNFQQFTGHTFTIRSSAPNYVSNEIKSKNIDVGSQGNEVKQCTSNNECESEKICTNGSCVVPSGKSFFNFYIIGLIIAVLILIIIVIKLLGKKQSQVSSSLTNL